MSKAVAKRSCMNPLSPETPMARYPLTRRESDAGGGTKARIREEER
jgi:hypothetical protein